MDPILEILNRGVERLLGRASGPLHLRLFIMPTVVTILAIRAGLRDVRERQPTFAWALVTMPSQRRQLFRSALKDIGKIFAVACVLDTIYQLFVLREFHIVELLIVAVACAVVPYVLVRGPVTPLMGLFYRKRAQSAGGATPDAEHRNQKRDDVAALPHPPDADKHGADWPGAGPSDGPPAGVNP